MGKFLIYVAGPISKGSISDNIERAHEAGLALVKAGFAVIVPHGSCFWGNKITEVTQSGTGRQWAAFEPEVLPGDSKIEDWYEMDLEIVGRCDAVLRLDGESKGADAEVTHALKLGKKVFYSVEEARSYVTGDC